MNWVAYANGGQASFQFDSSGFQASLTQTAPNLWDIQLMQPSVALQAGREYLLKLDLESSKALRLIGSVGQNGDPWQSYAGFNLDVRTGRQILETTLVPSTTDSLARLVFEHGKLAPATLHIYSISLVDKERLTTLRSDKLVLQSEPQRWLLQNQQLVKPLQSLGKSHSINPAGQRISPPLLP